MYARYLFLMLALTAVSSGAIVGRTVGPAVAVTSWDVGSLGDYTGTGLASTVYAPASTNDWYYNHHAWIVAHTGRLYCVWTQHPYRENGAGQRGVMSYSDNMGTNWSSVSVVVPSMTAAHYNRYAVTNLVQDPSAAPFVIGSDLWAVWNVVNWSQFEGSGEGNRNYTGRLATRITGTPTSVWVNADIANTNTGDTSWATYQYDAGISASVKAHLNQPANRPQWDYRAETTNGDGGPISSASTYGAYNVEPTAISTALGVVAYWRNESQGLAQYSQHKNGAWTDPNGTQLPNGFSRQYACSLSDGRTAIVGNMSNVSAFRNPLDIAISSNGLRWTTWATLASEGTTTPTYRNALNSTWADGRGGGPQYPHAMSYGGYLFFVFSTQKESIKIRRIAEADLP